MFTDLDKNKEMLLGSYKKLKSYYHYNKNFVFMKKKIAELEADEKHMLKVLENLAQLLADPDAEVNTQQIDDWLGKIDFYVMPKSFTSNSVKNELFISAESNEEKEVNKVNFFIDMPIELHLLETLWTVLIGKLVFEKELVSAKSYGNAIDDYVLYNKQDDFLDSINFTKNKLFKIYFPQYCNWKNDAIETVATLNRFNRSQMLFSLDVKSFYYSVVWKFDLLDEKMGDDERYIALKFLNLIIQRIFERYTGIVNEYRILEQCIENKEYILPIGLFSSMLLANVYMYELDNDISKKPNVLYYGRYVDDIILVVDITGDEKNISEDNAFDRYLVEKNNILVNVESGKYTINKYPNLYIQKEKVKIMYFNKTGSKTLINQLLKTITYPSQMNVIPDTELSLIDFEEAAYAKNGIGVETKIRDIGQLEIDRFQLGWHMSQIVMNNRVRKKYVTREEKVRRQNESDSILRFFQGVKALEYSSNWINAMYYFMLTSDTNRYAWKLFQGNIIHAIKHINVGTIEDIRSDKLRKIASKLKKDLTLHFDICISTVLALNIQYCRKEKKTVLALARKIRKANLFNHHLVSYPLVNYSDNIDEDCDLTNISPEQICSMNLLIRDSKKSKLSPRFINLDEIYQYVFLRKFINGGNYYADEDNAVVKKKLDFIESYFYEVNQINKGTASHLAISIKNEIHKQYILQRIELGDKCAVKEKIKIAIANIKLNTQRCCMGLGCGDNVEIDRLSMIDFMDRAYANGKKDKVDFLVFPEFYMPLQWISDVLAFVRKSGITVVSGLQYMTTIHHRGQFETVLLSWIKGVEKFTAYLHFLYSNKIV